MCAHVRSSGGLGLTCGNENNRRKIENETFYFYLSFFFERNLDINGSRDIYVFFGFVGFSAKLPSKKGKKMTLPGHSRNWGWGHRIANQIVALKNLVRGSQQ